MKTRYRDLIDQTFDFPTEEFQLSDNGLKFHNVDLMKLVEEHGTPLRFSYLPKISENITNARKWFRMAIAKYDYEGQYIQCYCTKTSHFSFVMDEVLKNKINLETSSAYDIEIIKRLYQLGKINADIFIVCNGYKIASYIDEIADLINMGFTNVIPVLDNIEELDRLLNKTHRKFQIGIRIASEEEPKFQFYTSRLGVGYKDIVQMYLERIHNHEQVSLKMLHFFINTGIRDTSYYWNELNKCLKVYTGLSQVCPSLDALNIGGGFPIKTSLAFDFDYEYMADEIVNQINITCKADGVSTPDIYTEFGSYTVGESGGMIYKIEQQKKQNDREKWNIIDSSFMTTLPDTWAINQRFIMLPLNQWNNEYERVFLGGLTCDSDDYYNSESHTNAIYLPQISKDEPLYIGFFHTGGYQDSISGYGGIKHCLIPAPKHVLITKDENGHVKSTVFSEEQTAEAMLSILGY